MRIYWLLFCCALAYADQPQQTPSLLVTSPVGKFQGSILKSYTGKDIYSFRGIQYAKAPTGHNRFKSATPAEPFSGVYNATDDGPVCPQPDVGVRYISEDCLYLNVYTTKLPESSSGQSPQSYPNRPVVVFIHPGAFIALSGASYEFGPQAILERDTVFVSFNYRLGALGFLSTGDSYAPGNAGLKDQVLALKWVQQNIQAFGGDPNKVTLAGYGSGAASVSLHLVSPLSTGLFHRAIIMSGSAVTQTPLPTDQKEFVKKQAEFIGCPHDSVANAVNCLYTKSQEEFSYSYFSLLKNSSSITVFAPVIEQQSAENPHPFLTEQPAAIFQQGKANKVPVFIGVNKDELGYAIIPAIEQLQAGNSYLVDQWNTKWEYQAPKNFDYESGTSKSFNVSNEFKSFYLHDEPLSINNYHGLANLYSDSLVNFRVYQLVKLLVQNSTEPVYYYKYVYEGCDTFKRWSNGSHYGVVHNDELFIAFQVRGRPTYCQKDLLMGSYAIDIITNFARTGNAALSNSGTAGFKWEPTTKDHPQYLQFGLDMKMVPGYIYEERMQKWSQQFPVPSYSA